MDSSSSCSWDAPVRPRVAEGGTPGEQMFSFVMRWSTPLRLQHFLEQRSTPYFACHQRAGLVGQRVLPGRRAAPLKDAAPSCGMSDMFRPGERVSGGAQGGAGGGGVGGGGGGGGLAPGAPGGRG